MKKNYVDNLKKSSSAKSNRNLLVIIKGRIKGGGEILG